jgi:hypothetical protein
VTSFLVAEATSGRVSVLQGEAQSSHLCARSGRLRLLHASCRPRSRGPDRRALVVIGSRFALKRVPLGTPVSPGRRCPSLLVSGIVHVAVAASTAVAR